MLFPTIQNLNVKDLEIHYVQALMKYCTNFIPVTPIFVFAIFLKIWCVKEIIHTILSCIYTFDFST